jgi:hypothetical protein
MPVKRYGGLGTLGVAAVPRFLKALGNVPMV